MNTKQVTSTTVKVAIVGGGVSGVAAANKLIKSGLTDVVILEAKDRLGGRIHTIEEGGGPLELGAQWIHGEEGNALCDIARNNGFLYKFKDTKTRKQSWLDFDDKDESGDDKDESGDDKDESGDDKDESDEEETGFFLSDGSKVSMKLINRVTSKFNYFLNAAELYFRDRKVERKGSFTNLLLEEIQNHNSVCLDYNLTPVTNGQEETAFSPQPQNEFVGVGEKGDVSVASFVEQHLAEYLELAEDEKTREIMLAILDWRLCVEKVENSCSSLYEIPISVWGEYYLCPGDEGVELGPKGYQPVIDYFVRDIPQSCVRLNSVVKKIDWNSVSGLNSGFTNGNAKPNGMFVNGDLNDDDSREVSQQLQQLHLNDKGNVGSHANDECDKFKKIKIELESGETYLADHALVTLPLGVLKYHCIQNTETEDIFTPRLPKKKLAAIEKLAYGTVDKIFLEFENPFWKGENALGFQLIWKRGEIVELDCLKRWGRCYEDTKWYRAIQGFDALLQHRNFLCGWIAGDEAKEMEKEEDEFVMDISRELLVRFSGMRDDEVEKPKKITRTKWSQDPYSRGSYSYRSFGSSIENSLDLAQPLPSEENPRLLFAGEATHGIFYSTTHGAMLTGVNQACVMLKHYQRN